MKRIFFIVLLLIATNLFSQSTFEFGFSGSVKKGNSEESPYKAFCSYERIYATSELFLKGLNGEDSNGLNYGELTVSFDYNFYKNWELWNKNFSIFSFGSATYNDAQILIYRKNAGLGGKYTFLEDRNDIDLGHDYSISLGVLGDFFHYENEKEKAITRLSLRPKVYQQFYSILIKTQIFYQPKVENFKDYRVISEIKIDYKILEILFYKFEWIYEYNSIVPRGVFTDDFLINNGLSIKF